jgi:hypothetical protein
MFRETLVLAAVAALLFCSSTGISYAQPVPCDCLCANPGSGISCKVTVRTAQAATYFGNIWSKNGYALGNKIALYSACHYKNDCPAGMPNINGDVDTVIPLYGLAIGKIVGLQPPSPNPAVVGSTFVFQIVGPFDQLITYPPN